jgi:hypothetical protein
MPQARPRIGPAGLALLAAATGSLASAETDLRTRVTIRGTGSNVTIERALVPVQRPAVVSGASVSAALGGAIRMKREGASDQSVGEYLLAHAPALPSIIESRYVADLRAAGAGRPLIAFLASLTAVDIGETGEGHDAVVVETSPGGDDAGAYGLPYGYPFIGGYASYGIPYAGRPFRPHRPKPHGPGMFPPGRPKFPGVPPSPPARHTSSRVGIQR